MIAEGARYVPLAALVGRIPWPKFVGQSQLRKRSFSDVLCVGCWSVQVSKGTGERAVMVQLNIGPHLGPSSCSVRRAEGHQDERQETIMSFTEAPSRGRKQYRNVLDHDGMTLLTRLPRTTNPSHVVQSILTLDTDARILKRPDPCRS